MTCNPCELAQRDPHRNDFTVGCESCKARALAAIGAHEESRDSGKGMTAHYRGVLDKMFGAEWKAGHKAVKDWAEKIDKYNKAKVTTK